MTIGSVNGKSTYLKTVADNLEALSKAVYHVTSIWVPRYHKKTERILKEPKSSLVCQLGSYRWKRMNEEDSHSTFFETKWLPAARKCTNYLWKVRSSFICLLCDEDHFTSISDSFMRSKDINRCVSPSKP